MPINNTMTAKENRRRSIIISCFNILHQDTEQTGHSDACPPGGGIVKGKKSRSYRSSPAEMHRRATAPVIRE
jgi:hypothetical protein